MAIWSRVVSIRWEKLVRNAKSSPAKMVDVSATPANEGTLCQYCDTLAQGTCYHCGAGACPRHSVLGVMVGLYVRGRLCNHCFWRIGEVCSDDDVTSGDEALGIQEDCIGFDCCGTDGPAEDWPASRTPLPQGS